MVVVAVRKWKILRVRLVAFLRCILLSHPRATCEMSIRDWRMGDLRDVRNVLYFASTQSSTGAERGAWKIYSLVTFTSDFNTQQVCRISPQVSSSSTAVFAYDSVNYHLLMYFTRTLFNCTSKRAVSMHALNKCRFNEKRRRGFFWHKHIIAFLLGWNSKNAECIVVSRVILYVFLLYANTLDGNQFWI